MTPAELAKHSAISFECKKDALQQRQSGDWKISFTVQGVDMDERITRAAMGTRFIAVLVEVDDLEMPVSKQLAKEVRPNPESESIPTGPNNALPQPDTPDKPQPAGAKRTASGEASSRSRMDWRELQPAAQAGIRCADVLFWAFLTETRPYRITHTLEASQAVREICGVKSRTELSTNHLSRVLWHQLDEHFQAWKIKERVGA